MLAWVFKIPALYALIIGSPDVHAGLQRSSDEKWLGSCKKLVGKRNIWSRSLYIVAGSLQGSLSEEGGVSWVLCTWVGWAYALSVVVPMNSSSRLCILWGVQLLENWDMEKNGQKGKCQTERWKRGIRALEVLSTFFFFFPFLESLLNFLIILLLVFF